MVPKFWWGSWMGKMFSKQTGNAPLYLFSVHLLPWKSGNPPDILCYEECNKEAKYYHTSLLERKSSCEWNKLIIDAYLVDGNRWKSLI